MWPHILYWDSFSHLIELIENTDFFAVSNAMRQQSLRDLDDITMAWGKVLEKLQAAEDRKAT